MVTVLVAVLPLAVPSLATTVMTRGVGSGAAVGVLVGHPPQQRLEIGNRLRRRGRDREHATASGLVVVS